MILTSNRGFAEWGDLFGHPVVATALLDRLPHHAVVFHIEGASYRPRQHVDLIPENLRLRPLAGITPPPRRRGRASKNQSLQSATHLNGVTANRGKLSRPNWGKLLRH
jgi:hypothetical protein